jgi:competence protein ComEC
MDNAQRIALLCLTFAVGLLVSPQFTWAMFNQPLWTIGGLACLSMAIYLGDRNKRLNLPLNWTIAAVAVLISAVIYCQLRLPQPSSQDISRFINSINDQGQSQFSSVKGIVDSYPKVTRTNRSQFWLQVNQLTDIQGDAPGPASTKQVNGRLYVTAPLLSTTGLKPGVEVVLTGTLYKPQPSLNPGGLNFSDYLARSGSWAGIRVAQLILPDENQIRRWDIGTLRQRIVQAQVKWLDIPAGPLVSAMSLGGDVVDVPFDVKDWFGRVGLTHALAASGFQVSLIVSAVINITQRFLSKKWQFGLGLLAIGLFVSLTGFQPSILRAAVMGGAVLLSLLLGQQLCPLNSLLLAGVLLLIGNPIWIWDVGFQLSFLATLGLVVSATPIQCKLDWLPPTIAELVAVPLAATIWTMPIQLWHFKVLPLYALPANIISSPLVAIISIGGMISAMISAILPPVGSAIAWLLLYPTQLLIGIVRIIATLPGANMSVGSIGLVQLIFIYGLILLVWRMPFWQKRWHLALLVAIFAVMVPLWITKNQELKITALASGEEQVLVVQNHYQTTLINAGNSETARFTVLPFLTHEAINELHQAIGLHQNRDVNKGWQTISNSVSIDKFYTPALSSSPSPSVRNALVLNTERMELGNCATKLWNAQPPLLALDIAQQHWLIIGNLPLDQQRDLAPQLQPVESIYWPGGKLTNELVKIIRPQVAIASTTNPDTETIQKLEGMGTKVFITGRDGAVQWTTEQGFKTFHNEN